MKEEDYNFQGEVREHLRLENLARKILGVAEGASPAEIKKAYWLLAMKHHPDKNPGDRESERQFQNIRAAYDFLTRNSDGRHMSQETEFPLPDSVSEKYNTSNSWGYFLWWRDKFFK